MSTGLDRSLKHGQLLSYLSSDRTYYEKLAYLNPDDRALFDVARNVLPESWQLKRAGIWTHSVSASDSLPAQGFKIHLSATPDQAQSILRDACEVCARFELPFKYLSNLAILEKFNSKNYYRGASGKFITVYPDDTAEFKEVIEVFYRTLSGMHGPYILSDRNYKNSSTVYYRYGGISKNSQLNVFGESEEYIVDDEGDPVRDRRLPYFNLPEWVAPPFGRGSVNTSSDVILNRRYSIERAYKMSNAGGVYLAEDTATNEEVIIKESRPCISMSRESNMDAVDRLENEYQALTSLSEVPYVVNPIDFFRSGRHSYLVEEKIQGESFATFRGKVEHAPALNKNLTPEAIARFCQTFRDIAEGLMEAVARIHDEGFIIGDLSATNVFVDPDSLAITLIDFGSAVKRGTEVPAQELQVTSGYFPPDRLPDRIDETVVAECSGDYYAVGALLYGMIFPIEGYFGLNPSVRWTFLKRFTTRLGLPSELRKVIHALMKNQNLEEARAYLEVVPVRADEIGSRREPNTANPSLNTGEHGGVAGPNERCESDRANIEETLDGILTHLDATADFSRDDRLWPVDYRGLQTNPLSIAFGASGIALFIQRLRGTVSDDIITWLLDREVTPSTYAPGLYVGQSGIAWAFDELGLHDRAEDILRSVESSNLLGKSPDIFYGDSGVGLTYLRFWHRTQNAYYLDEARRIGESLRMRSIERDEGIAWKNEDDDVHFGYAHGGSGIAHFLLELHIATGEVRYLEMAQRAIDFELAHAVVDPTDDSLSWTHAEGEENETRYSYWRYGSAGVGSVLIRLAAYLDDATYRTQADRAARETMRQFTIQPNLFDGMSGMGEFLIDMYRFTEEEEYLDAAWDLRGVTAFSAERDGGIVFPGDHLARYSTDYATGSAGVGTFLHRLIHPDTQRLFHDIRRPAEETTGRGAVSASVRV